MKHFTNRGSTKYYYKKCWTPSRKHRQNKKNNNNNISAKNKNLKSRKQNKKNRKKNNKKTADLIKIIFFKIIRKKLKDIKKVVILMPYIIFIEKLFQQNFDYNMELDKIQKKINIMQGNQQCQVFTNSCIQLSIPHQYLQSGALTYVWHSSNNLKHESQLVQFIFSHSNNMKNNQQSFYICSPLDLGCFLSVKIQQQGYKNKIFLEEINYGCVKMEDNLMDTLFSGAWKHAELIINKEIKRQASLQIKTDLFQTFTPVIKICLRMGTTQFNVIISEEIAKNILDTNHRQGLFKFYDSEPNTIGIYIGHQIQEFIQKINEEKIFCHVGSYIKLCFHDKKCRDIFVFYIISRSNVSIDGIKEFRKLINQITQKNKNQLAHPHKKQEMNLKIPKIQSTIRSSEMMSFEMMNSSLMENQNNAKNPSNILEDIYNILYHPINKIGIQSLNQENQVNYGVNSHQTLQNLNNFIESTHTQKEKERLSHSPESQKRATSIKKEQMMYLPIIEQKKRNHISLKTMQSLTISRDHLQSPQYHKHDTHKNQQKKNYFKKELKEIDLLERINELTRNNEHLILQNKMLKQENQRLKLTKQSEKAHYQLAKMLEIKTMVQVMAQKLQQLEDSHSRTDVVPLNSPRRNVKTPYNLDSFGRIVEAQKELRPTEAPVGNQKRFWSPRAHQQIIKSIKQRNQQQKQLKQSSIQKNGKKKQHNQPSSPDLKQNHRVIKNYTSLTKKSNYSPVRQHQEQKLKKQKAQVLGNKSQQNQVTTKNITIEHGPSTPQFFLRNAKH